MAISVADLKFYQAERMTDFDDGGGQMSGNEIISGADNQIFPDISDVDRAAGDLSIRKVYSAVTSADTDEYLDAGVVIFKPPTDPNTSVVAFSTGSYYDERDDLVALLESSISRGVRFNGWLYGQHIAGQRAILIWSRPEVAAPSTGGRLSLVAKSGSTEQYAEYIWILSIAEERRIMRDDKGEYEIKVFTAEIAYPLANPYAGLEPNRFDPTTATATSLVYETRYNPDIVALYGIKPLAALAEVGDYAVQVSGGLYQQMIPTGLQETALADTNPGGDSAALIGGAASLEGRVSFTTAANLVKPDGTLYLGRACLPGTLTITVSGATLTDQDGAIKLGGTTVVGTLDYSNGIARFTSACPNYGTASKAVSFGPAVRDLRVADTASIVVTLENRGYVYVLTLAPIPAPGSLRVSYQVNGNWYTLYEQGNGVLSGADSSYGAGSLNYTSGTVTITTGELPDVDSLILFAWTTPVNYTARGAASVIPARFSGALAHPGIVPGSVTASWGAITLSEPGTPNGTLTGTGGAGTIDYATGEWMITPTTLPAVGTQITLAYDYTIAANVKTETFEQPAREPDDSIILTLNETNLEPRSVRVRFNVGVASSARVSWWGDIGQVNFDNFQITAKDDGAGSLTSNSGTVDYINGVVTLTPDREVSYPLPNYEPLGMGTSQMTLGGLIAPVTLPLWKTVATSWSSQTVPAVFPVTGGVVTVEYRLDGDSPSTSEVFTFSQLEFDLTRGFAETIVSGSVDLTLGSSRYVSTAGQIYRDPSPETGAGTLAGSLDPTTGVVRLSNWTAGANAVTASSFVTVLGGQPVDACMIRSPVANLRPGSVQIRAVTTAGAVLSETVPQSGILETQELTANVNYPDGVMSLRFGAWVDPANLTPEELLEPWYDPEAIISYTDLLLEVTVSRIWKPLPVLADSIIYNAVAQTTLPPDRDMIGIDASRLPPDGKGLIFQRGRLVLVHHTDAIAQSNLSPTQVIDCARTRLYRVVIDDVNGQRLPASFYAVNRELGTVTMASDLNLTGYTGPYAIQHTVADLVRTTAVDINGTLTLNKPVSHDYPADDSYCSGVLYIGTLQARYTNLFAQATWTSVWSDSRIGDAPLAQYNDTAYPIQVSNLGAYKDRILIRFTSSTAFQVIGENLGVIGVGSTTQDCSPVNQLTGQPYFTVDYRGWGSGWSTGNCVRFNLIGANYPVDLIRAIQPSDPSGLDDAVELLFIGNTDSE